MTWAFSITVLCVHFAAFVLFITPLPWLPKAWNVGACINLVWRGLRSLVGFMDGILWAGNTMNKAPVWCDITIKVITGANFALTASGLAINRRLYIISTDPIGVLGAKRRIVMEDLAISLGIPIILTMLSFIPQRHRFIILEDIGCRGPYYNTIPAILLELVPPVILGIMSAVYGGLNLISFYRRRRSIQEFMMSDSTTLKFGHYIRLKSLGFVEIMATVPWAIYVLFAYIVDDWPVHPWVWKDVKADYGTIQHLTMADWNTPRATATLVKVDMWFNLACAAFSFLVFGCTKEQCTRYKGACSRIFRLQHYRSNSKPSSPCPKLEAGSISIQFSANPSLFASTPSLTVDGGSIDEAASRSTFVHGISGEPCNLGSMPCSKKSIDVLRVEEGQMNEDTRHLMKDA
ncbi:hypothetical protein HGRIS_003523 [Hohenbuehelia grisea]|uniref:Pheromone receptor n=1 Tax=Hohenbuehelia grisea TaxID=104357 RepID=A0ABR3JGS4_9AGAR